MPLNPAIIPTFQMRAAVTLIDGVAPAGNRIFTWDIESDQTASVISPAHVQSTGNAFSPWMVFNLASATAIVAQYPNSQVNDWPLVGNLVTDNCAPDRTTVVVEVKFDADPSTVLTWTAVLIRNFWGQTAGKVACGFCIWVDGQGNHILRQAEYNRQFYWTPNAPYELASQDRPVNIILEDRLIGRTDEEDYWTDGITHLRNFGNTLLDQNGVTRVRTALIASGITGFRTADAVTAGDYVGYSYANDAAEDAAINTWGHARVDSFLAAGYVGADCVQAAHGDEASLPNPRNLNRLKANASAVSRFQGWLRGDYANQGGPQVEDFSPGSFGAAAWTDLLPTGRSTVTDPNASLAVRRLYLQSCLFQEWDSERWFAKGRQKLQDLTRSDLQVAMNSNCYRGQFTSCDNPGNGLGGADSGGIGYNWWRWGSMRAGTELYSEDWITDDRPMLLSYYGNILRSASQYAGLSWGYYIVPITPNERANGALQKFVSIISHKPRSIYHYVFGPAWTFPGSPYSWHLPITLQKIAQCHKYAKVLDASWNSLVHQVCPVAILHPDKSWAWEDRANAPSINVVGDPATAYPYNHNADYGVDEWGWHLAMQHGGYPVNSIDAVQCTSLGLAPYSVVIVTEPNIPQRYQQALIAWVNAGGTLVRVCNTGQSDEYDDPLSTFPDFDGIGENRRLREYSHANNNTSRGSVGGSTTWGPWATLTGTGGGSATVYKTRNDGQPGIIVKPVGLGRVVYYSFFPGMSYWRSQTGFTDLLPTGFSQNLRDMMMYPLTLAGVQKLATVQDMVEYKVLRGPSTLAVTLINHTGVPINNLPISIPIPWLTDSGVLASGQTPSGLSFLGNQVTLTIPQLDGAEILVLNQQNQPIGTEGRLARYDDNVLGGFKWL